MHGTNLSVIALRRCAVCRKFVAVRLDPDDLDRHRSGVPVQDAFTNENGVPYMSAGDRELFISGVCSDCWSLLCAPNPLDYS